MRLPRQFQVYLFFYEKAFSVKKYHKQKPTNKTKLSWGTVCILTKISTFIFKAKYYLIDPKISPMALYSILLQTDNPLSLLLE